MWFQHALVVHDFVAREQSTGGHGTHDMSGFYADNLAGIGTRHINPSHGMDLVS
jgi:hypothetical protein